jgi:hypothetical protein
VLRGIYRMYTTTVIPRNGFVQKLYLQYYNFRYTVHSPNVHSPNDQSTNDQSPNDHSPNDQSSEFQKCDQSPNATISRTTIFRKTNLQMRLIRNVKNRVATKSCDTKLSKHLAKFRRHFCTQQILNHLSYIAP